MKLSTENLKKNSNLQPFKSKVQNISVKKNKIPRAKRIVSPSHLSPVELERTTGNGSAAVTQRLHAISTLGYKTDGSGCSGSVCSGEPDQMAQVLDCRRPTLDPRLHATVLCGSPTETDMPRVVSRSPPSHRRRRSPSPRYGGRRSRRDRSHSPYSLSRYAPLPNPFLSAPPLA